MDQNTAAATALRMQRLAKTLEGNNFDVVCLETKEQVIPTLETMIEKTETVSVGGSMTLFETGVIDWLRTWGCTFHDRYAPGLTGEQMSDIFRGAFTDDVYLTSTNAVTEAGEILNVDGNANRVAAITFGPASVILVVGCNKIVKDLAAADARVKAVAAPANAKRLSCKTPCAVTGQCENCQSPGRICCTYVLHRYQRVPGRIKVILVGQELGY